MGVIEPVDEPTDWVSNVVVATKPNGDLRICIDPQQLNKALKRERYPIPVIEDVLPELSKAKVFTKVDARNGYWHVVLEEESAKLTTFDTPFGRYYWKRLPFGLSVSSEIFQKRIHQALDGLPGLLDVHDDMVIYGRGDTDEQADADHDRNLEKFLQRCREKGVKLNKQKLKLKCTEFPYLGHLVTKDGLKPDPDKIKAVQEMPKPDDIKAVRRFCGFVNYLAKFMPKLSDVMEPIRNLTCQENEYNWTHEHDAAFIRVKEMATTAPLLRYYNPAEELTIQCDASEKGLGAALLQKGQPVAFASRALTETESRYAQIEKELLAVVYALDKFEQYAYGRPVTIESDHKPLEAIAKKPLRCAPKRLQGMFLKIQKFDTNIVYKPGTRMYLADTLSRANLSSSKNTQGSFETVNALKILPVPEDKHDRILKHTSEDQVLQLLKEVILKGWPEDKKTLPAVLNAYYSYRDELSVYDGLIFRGERLVIPKALRYETMKELHSSHIGVNGCLRRARECLFWPAMSAEIKEYIAQCQICSQHSARQPKETLMSHEATDRPWEKVGADIYTIYGKDYLISVDYFSNFWEIDRLRDTKASTCVRKLKSHFARNGIPDVVVTDNGPQFTSTEFAVFAREWGFEHRTSSPGHQQANGQAESAVKTAKNILRKAMESGNDPYLAILAVRNTPTEYMDSSPAQRLMGRRTKTGLPMTAALLKPQQVNAEGVKKQIMTRQQTQAHYYNKKARDLPPLSEGDVVRMRPFTLNKKTWQQATVSKRLDERSYEVETEDATYRRNRVDLRKTHEEATCKTPDRKEASLTTTPAAEPPHVALRPTPVSSRRTAERSSKTVEPAHAEIAEPVRAEITEPGHAESRPRRIVKEPAYLKDYVRK